MIHGELTIGSFTAFATYVQLYEDGFSSLANIWTNLLQTLASTGRFLRLLEREPSVLPNLGRRPPSCSGALELKAVTFSYPSSPAPVLIELSLHVHPGEVVALVGESGAGKSTIGR